MVGVKPGIICITITRKVNDSDAGRQRINVPEEFDPIRLVRKLTGDYMKILTCEQDAKALV